MCNQNESPKRRIKRESLGLDLHVVGAHADALALEDRGLVGLLVAALLGLVVVFLGEATGHVALGRGLHVEDDQEGGGDDDEERGGDDSEDVDTLERNLVHLLRGERGGGGEGGEGGGDGRGERLGGSLGDDLGAGGGAGSDDDSLDLGGGVAGGLVRIWFFVWRSSSGFAIRGVSSSRSVGQDRGGRARDAWVLNADANAGSVREDTAGDASHGEDRRIDRDGPRVRLHAWAPSPIGWFAGL